MTSGRKRRTAETESCQERRKENIDGGLCGRNSRGASIEGAPTRRSTNSKRGSAVLRQQASAERAEERAHKCIERLEAQCLWVMQTVERAMRQQASRL